MLCDFFRNKLCYDTISEDEEVEDNHAILVKKYKFEFFSLISKDNFTLVDSLYKKIFAY